MKDIKIALYGQFNNDTTYGFTFPDDFNSAMTMTAKEEWMRTISDPRDDARVFNTSRIYTVWKNADGGNYYGVIVPNKKDTRNGYILLVLYIDKQLPRSGTVIIDALAFLEKKLIEEGVRDKQMVAQYVDGIRSQFIVDVSGAATAPAAKTQTRAYRLYSNEQELAELFYYPNQEAYAPYNRVLFVPQEAAPQNAIANFQQLSNSIRRSYSILCPEGVSADRKTVTDDGKFVVTYTKAGYSPTQYEITVKNANSKLYTIEGNTVRVKDAAEAGVTFKRKARFRVFSQTSHQPVSPFLVDGVRMQFDQEAVVGDNEEMTFKIDASGFRTKTVKVRMADLMRDSFLVQVDLEPKEETVKIRAYVDGKAVSGSAHMQADDPLLPYLRSAAYEVNISKTNKAAATTAKTAAAAQADAKGNSRQPLMKTLLVAFAALAIGFLLGTVLRGGSHDTGDDDEGPTSGTMRPPINASSGANSEADEEYDDDTDDDTDDDDTDLTGGPTDEELLFQEEQRAFEEEDLLYMKKEDTWSLNDLKSQKYKQLIVDMETANYEGVLNNEYTTNNTLVRNNYWVKMTMALAAIVEEGDPDRLKECDFEFTQRLVKNGKANIAELCSAIMSISKRSAKRTAGDAAPAVTGGTRTGGTPARTNTPAGRHTTGQATGSSQAAGATQGDGPQIRSDE